VSLSEEPAAPATLVVLVPLLVLEAPPLEPEPEPVPEPDLPAAVEVALALAMVELSALVEAAAASAEFAWAALVADAVWSAAVVLPCPTSEPDPQAALVRDTATIKSPKTLDVGRSRGAGPPDGQTKGIKPLHMPFSSALSRARHVLPQGVCVRACVFASGAAPPARVGQVRTLGQAAS